MAGHFALDVDADGLEAAGGGLLDLGNHLITRAAEVRGAPGEIPQQAWAGGTRTAITAEMTALGGQLAGFGPKFTAAGQALKKVADQARTAKEVTLPNLNSRWNQADEAHRDTVAKAGSEFVGPVTPQVQKQQEATRDKHVAEAGAARAAAQGKLTREYDALVADLKAAFAQASGALAAATLVAVPDATVAGFIGRGGTGMSGTWTSPDGLAFPPELGARVLLGKDLHLYDGKRALDDAARAGELTSRIRDTDTEPTQAQLAEFNRLLAQNKGNKTFATTLLNGLGPAGLLDLTGRVSTLVADDPTAENENDIGPLPKIIASVHENLGNTLATATLQPGGPNQVSAQWITDLTAVGRQKVEMGGRTGAIKGPLEVYGYQLLGVLLHRGTYSAPFLDTVGSDMIAFEREHGKGKLEDASRFWTDNSANEYARLNWFDGWGPTAQAGYDPLVGLMAALSHNPDGARAFFTGGEKDGRLPRVDYLLTDRTWPKDLMTSPHDLHHQRLAPLKDHPSGGLDQLGSALEAATIKDPDARSVKIVESLVKEVSIDEQARGYGNGEESDRKATTFDQVNLLPPAIRDSMARIMGGWMPSVHGALDGGASQPTGPDGDRDPYLPGIQTLAATFDETELMRFLADVGKDADARQELFTSEARYAAIAYGEALKNGGDPGTLKAISTGAGKLFGTLDFGANAATHGTSRVADATANTNLQKWHSVGTGAAFLAGGWINESRFPLGTLTFITLREFLIEYEKAFKHDHTGDVNYATGNRIGNGVEQIEYLASAVLYHNTPAADLPAELKDPKTGKPIPMKEWKRDGEEWRAWENFVTKPGSKGSHLSGLRATAGQDYELGYQGAVNRLQAHDGP